MEGRKGLIQPLDRLLFPEKGGAAGTRAEAIREVDGVRDLGLQ